MAARPVGLRPVTPAVGVAVRPMRAAVRGVSVIPRLGPRAADPGIDPPEEPPVPVRSVVRVVGAAPQVGLRPADWGRRRAERPNVDRREVVRGDASVVRPAGIRSGEADAGPAVARPVRLRASGPGAGPAARSDAARSAGRRVRGAPVGARMPVGAAPRAHNGSPRDGRRSPGPGGWVVVPVGCVVPEAGVRRAEGSSSAVAARVHARCRRRLLCRYHRGTRCSAHRSYPVPRAAAVRVPTVPEGPGGQEHRRDVGQVVADERKNHRRSSCLLYRPGPRLTGVRCVAANTSPVRCGARCPVYHVRLCSYARRVPRSPAYRRAMRPAHTFHLPWGITTGHPPLSDRHRSALFTTGAVLPRAGPRAGCSGRSDVFGRAGRFGGRLRGCPVRVAAEPAAGPAVPVDPLSHTRIDTLVGRVRLSVESPPQPASGQ